MEGVVIESNRRQKSRLQIATWAPFEVYPLEEVCSIETWMKKPSRGWSELDRGMRKSCGIKNACAFMSTCLVKKVRKQGYTHDDLFFCPSLYPLSMDRVSPD